MTEVWNLEGGERSRVRGVYWSILQFQTLRATIITVVQHCSEEAGGGGKPCNIWQHFRVEYRV